jgi:hypothetical protein
MESQYEYHGKEKALLETLTAVHPDYRSAQMLIEGGADVNAHRGSFYLFYDIVNKIRSEESCYQAAVFLLEQGFDAQKYGVNAYIPFAYGETRARLFTLCKLLLSAGMDHADPEQLERLLGALGTEESYSSCCEQDHKKENLYYATYELVDAAWKGKEYAGIGYWKDCIGLRVDKACALSRAKEIVSLNPLNRCEYRKPIFFKCGDKAIIMETGPNLYMQSWKIVKRRKKETPLNDSFTDIVGATIKNIQFEHNSCRRGNTDYIQPIIQVSFDNGKSLKLSRNAGEVPPHRSKAYFVFTESTKQI